MNLFALNGLNWIPNAEELIEINIYIYIYVSENVSKATFQFEYEYWIVVYNKKNVDNKTKICINIIFIILFMLYKCI